MSSYYFFFRHKIISFPAVLLYRICRCFRRIYVKLLHAIFHALAFPCIVIGFLAVLDYHNKKGINNFYSLHSWIGFVAMGLFGIQVIYFFLNCNKYQFRLTAASRNIWQRASGRMVHCIVSLKIIFCDSELHIWSR